jgi:hypothetical protein
VSEVVAVVATSSAAGVTGDDAALSTPGGLGSSRGAAEGCNGTEAATFPALSGVHAAAVGPPAAVCLATGYAGWLGGGRAVGL